jgi:hypothetical protein
MTIGSIRTALVIPLSLLLLTLLFSGCSQQKRQQGIPQSEWEKLIVIRTEARSLYSELMTDCYNFAVLRRQSNLEEITARYESLLDRKNIQLVQRIEDSYQPSPEETQVRLLRLFLIQGALKLATGQSIDYLRTLQVQNQIAAGGNVGDNRSLPGLGAEATNREQRLRQFEAQLPVLVKENAVCQRIRLLEDSLLFDLGYGDMASFLVEQHDVDLAVLATTAEQFIKDTDSLTRALFVELAPKLTGVPVESFRGYDLLLLERGQAFDKHFPAGKMIDGIKSVLVEMGLSIDSANGLRITVLDNSHSGFPHVAYPIRVPDDIRLPVRPADGAPGYAAFYHQLGQALSYANITERDFEFTYLGNQTLTAASAFLFEQLLDQPAYLQNRLGFSPVETGEYLRYRALIKLMTVRACCGDLLYEQSLYSGETDLKAEYERIKQPLLGYPWSDIEREGYLTRASYLSSADYLRGWFLSAQLQEKLQTFVGPDYASKPATGDLLKKIWGAGSRYTPEEVAQSLGIDAITPDALHRQINAMLQ